MRNLLLLVLLLATTSIYTQTTLADYEEVVYLKNGSVIRGIIVEEIPGTSLKIQTREKNLFVYKMEEVEKITRELYNGDGGSGPGNDTRKKKGFNAYIDQGVAIWFSGDPFPMNHTSLTFGYKANKVFYIGGGVGLLARKGFLAVPVYADMRLTLTKTKVAPLVNFQFGYLSPSVLNDSDYGYDSRGGTYFSVRPGLGINLKKDIDLNFYTGYVMGSQMYKSYYDDLEVDLMHMFTFTTGIKF